MTSAAETAPHPPAPRAGGPGRVSWLAPFLLLSVAAALSFIWARSYFAYDVFDTHGAAFGSYRGHLLLAGYSKEQSTWAFNHFTDSLPDAVAENTWQTLRTTASWQVFGVSFSRDPSLPGSWVLALPDAIPALALVAAGANLVARRRRAKRRARQGSCPACGYDLRASPGRCPECGTVARITP